MIFRTQDSQEKYSSCCSCCCCSCLASCSSSDTSYDLTDLLSLSLLLLHPPHQLITHHSSPTHCSTLLLSFLHCINHHSTASCTLHLLGCCCWAFLHFCFHFHLQQLILATSCSSSELILHMPVASSLLVICFCCCIPFHPQLASLNPLPILLASCFLLLLLLLNHHRLTSPELPAPAGTSTKHHSCLFSPD